MQSWSQSRDGDRLEVRGELRPKPGLLAKLAAGVGAGIVITALGWVQDPVSVGLWMLTGGILGTLGLRRLLLGSLEHRTEFRAGEVIREESGSQAPPRTRAYFLDDLRCVGLSRLQVGNLGHEQRLVLVLSDRGVLTLGRELGTSDALQGLGQELAARVGLPFEQIEGWPRHEWRSPSENLHGDIAQDAEKRGDEEKG